MRITGIFAVLIGLTSLHRSRYSLIETCCKFGLNPAEYLRELFEALPNMEQSEIAGWAPAHWNASRESLAFESA